MIGGRGVVLTSEEAIHENKDTFTHWTPILKGILKII